jgi:hypothetical protein
MSNAPPPKEPRHHCAACLRMSAPFNARGLCQWCADFIDAKARWLREQPATVLQKPREDT